MSTAPFVVTTIEGVRITVVPPGAAPPTMDIKSIPTPTLQAACVVTLQPAAAVASKGSHVTLVDTTEFTCPHCKQQGFIPNNEINCAIFRHAQYKSYRYPTSKTAPEDRKQMELYNASINPALCGQFVPPHLPEAECALLIAAGHIEGCGRPCMLKNGIAVPCSYAA
jgi:hypothetical protein